MLSLQFYAVSCWPVFEGAQRGCWCMLVSHYLSAELGALQQFSRDLRYLLSDLRRHSIVMVRM